MMSEKDTEFWRSMNYCVNLEKIDADGIQKIYDQRNALYAVLQELCNMSYDNDAVRITNEFHKGCKCGQCYDYVVTAIDRGVEKRIAEDESVEMLAKEIYEMGEE